MMVSAVECFVFEAVAIVDLCRPTVLPQGVTRCGSLGTGTV